MKANDLDLCYFLGKNLVLADTITIASMKRLPGNIQNLDDIEVHAGSILSALVSEKTLKKLRMATENYETL